jgi:UDP-4-amino-4,6-dideoxy-N-acetyl-beta-L-altrosamine transaminase
MIPYGHQQISEEDIQEVVNVLRSDWLTQGPMVERFERAVAEYCEVRYAVAVSSGTAALHLATLAAGFQQGDEVITSPITFAASVNCIVYSGATPVFADIDRKTYCVDYIEINRKITKKTKGIIPIHFTGQPCDMAKIAVIAHENDLIVIEDAAHALGASYEVNGQSYKVGSCTHSDMTTFSFHPVKHITTGEGGMITTNSYEFYRKICLLRTHGITKDEKELIKNDGLWYYEQHELGFNYRITDLQCALGVSQLKRLDKFIEKRKCIAATYNKSFKSVEQITIPFQKEAASSAWHLYVIKCNTEKRNSIFELLRKCDIGVNVHYIPMHTHPYYQKKFGFTWGDFPRSEDYYQHAITLPIFPSLHDDEIEYIISSVLESVKTA